MELEKYLELVAAKITEAQQRSNWTEVESLLRTCAETLIEKAEEIRLEKN